MHPVRDSSEERVKVSEGIYIWSTKIKIIVFIYLAFLKHFTVHTTIYFLSDNKHDITCSVIRTGITVISNLSAKLA